MNAIQTLLTNHLDIWTDADTEKKSGRGRSSGNAASVYGIKKLRELILELAVRGKLVPQDLNDESASALLNRIQVERAKLITEGKLKVDKPLPPIAENEKPFELPKGWVWCRFGVLVNICTGKLDANAANANGQYPFFTCSQTPSKIDTYSFDTAAVLLAGNGDFNVKFYQGKFDAYQRTYVIEPVVFGLKFCYLLVLAQIETITKNNRGSAIPYLKIGDLTEPVFALPPLPEQHRIVAKVDELMAMCDQLEQQQTHSLEAHQELVASLLGTLTRVASQQELNAAWARIANHFDTLFTTEASIDQLKQTILQLAVMGKLVPQDPNDESASVLLEEIATEKARLVEEGKIKKEKQPADRSTLRDPFGIPDRWTWSDLSQLLALVTDGDHQAPPQSEEGVPFLVIGNLNTGRINFDGCKFVPIDYYEKLDWVRKPIAGDLLYTVTGSFGIPVPVETREQFCVQRHVAILKATASTPRRYLALVLGSIFAIDYATTIATGIAQKTVPLTGLRRMPIPVAPEKEQHSIVAKVDELMALCDTLKTRIKNAQAIQLHLADAIVEQAVC